MIHSVKNISFKGYVPVTYYAKHPSQEEYVPVLKKENIRKCNGYLVRNLNGTAKNIKNQGLVDFFESKDEDYKNSRIVHSVYEKNSPVVYIVTGNDAIEIEKSAHNLGSAKKEAIEKTGKAKSFEVSYLGRKYIEDAKKYILSKCKRLKSENGYELSLQVFFNPKYNKKNELISFDFSHAKFVDKYGHENIYSALNNEQTEGNYKIDADNQLFFLS